MNAQKYILAIFLVLLSHNYIDFESVVSFK